MRGLALGIPMRLQSSTCMLAAVALTLFAAPASAQEQRLSIDVSASGDAATNPYLVNGTSTEALSATIQFEPRISFVTEGGRFDVTALVQLRQYVSKYGLEDNYALRGNWNERASDQLTLRANFNASQTEANTGISSLQSPGTVDPGDAGNLPQIPSGQFDPALLPDPTSLGQRSKMTNFDAAFGASYQLGAFETISGDVGGRIVRYDNPNLDDFNSLFQEISYARMLDDQTTVGLVFSASVADYSNVRFADSLSISPLLSVSYRASEYLTISGAAGLAFTRISRDAPLDDVWVNSLSLRAQVCNRNSLSSLCLTGVRSPQPSASGGVRTANALNLDYSRKMSSVDRLSLGAAYTLNGQPLANNLATQSFDRYTLRAQYDHDFEQRLAGFANATFSDSFKGTDRKSNIAVSVGVRMGFGDNR